MDNKIEVALLQQSSLSETGLIERELTTEEREVLNETITGVVLEEETLTEEKKAAAADFKLRGKDIATRKKDYIKQKRTGRITEIGMIHTFFKLEEGNRWMAYGYNNKGEQLWVRRMRSSEIDAHQHLLTEQEGVIPFNKPQLHAGNG